MIEKLRDASIAEVADVLRQHFQLRGPMAPDPGAREIEFAYDLPLKWWREADGELRRSLVQASETLIKEIPRPDWSAEAVEALVTFIDLAEMDQLRFALQDAVESGRWLKAEDDGLRHQMVALRTLLDLGWAGTPGFWRNLPADLNARYPALAFRGLLEQGPGLAFAWLPHLATDPRAVRRIVDVLSSLIRDEGSEAVCEKLRAVCPQLEHEVVAEFERWFRAHGWGRVTGPPCEVRATLPQQRAVGLCLIRPADEPWNDAPTRPGLVDFYRQTA